MTDAWQALYDGIYDSIIAVDADLTSASGAAVTLRVCDETKGTVIAGGQGNVETVRPTCRVRATELSANGIDLTDLPDGNIIFNGKNWIVKATQLHPSPTGEAGGEVMMILQSGES